MSSTTSPIAGPISQDWTAHHLLENLADDIEAVPLDVLLAVEARLLERRASGGVTWARRPHPVAVIRSIAALIRTDRPAAQLTLGQLGVGSLGSVHVVARRASNTRAPHAAESPAPGNSGEFSRILDGAQPTLS